MGNQTSGYFLIPSNSAVDGPNYNYNKDYNQERLHADYTAFYVGISFCAVLLVLLIIVNLILGYCSPWKKYWTNRNLGNRLIKTSVRRLGLASTHSCFRFILPLFISAPKNQGTILI